MKIFILLVLVGTVFSVCPQKRTDLIKWSSNTNWMQAGANVVIPSGTNVLLDVSPPQLVSIEVDGDLVFNDTNLNLNTEWIRVSSTGRLFIGSQDSGCAIMNKITITLIGGRNTTQAMGTDPFDGVTLGYKGIAILTGATVSIVGNVQGPTWTRLAQTAVNGSSSIIVQDTVNWKVGDEILIVTTDFSETSLLRNISSSINWQQGRGTPNQNEVRIISSISGNTITFAAPLNYTHWGAGFEFAEVGLLNRQIIIQGDDSSDHSFFGGHFMIRKVANATIIGVEINRMGQRGLLGRYPLHFHLAKECWDSGYLVQQNSIRNSFQRCVVIHETSGVNINNNVAFNNTGHCYFLEDGSERGNTFDHNLGVQTYPVSITDPLNVLPTDVQPAMFWITNPNNTWTNNAAVGGRFGYWFSMPAQPTGPSANDFLANDTWVRPRWTPLGQFENNTAHSCARDGLHIDDMVNPNLVPSLSTELSSYSPRNGPYTPTGGYTSLATALFESFTAYKNRQYGVWARGGPMIFNNVRSLDNMRGFNTPPSPAVLQNSYIVGETDNIGTPVAAELGRSRPDPYNNNAYIKGWETYDNGGAQYVKDTVFENFTANAIRPSGVFSNLECGPFILQARDYIKNITFINANPVWVNPCNSDCPGNWAIFDTDGSVTGKPGWLVSNTSITTTDPNCVAHPEWNGFYCPPFGDRFVQIFINFVGSANSTDPAFNGTYNKNLHSQTHATFNPMGTDGSLRYENRGSYLSGSTSFQMMANLRPRQQGYHVIFNGSLPTWPDIKINMASALPQDWIYLAFTYPASNLPLNVSLVRGSIVINVTPVASLAQVISKYNYYYDSANEVLYIRLDATDESMDQRWGFTGLAGSDGWYTEIVSTCAGSGLGCKVPTKYGIPAGVSYEAMEDEFYADVEPCQSATDPSTDTTSSTAMFRLNPTNYTLSYYFVHDQTYNNITQISIMKGAIGSVGTQIQVFAFFDNPIGWYTKLTRNIWMALLKGELYISVQTANKQEAIRGQIGCQGTCSLPPPVSVADKCSVDAYGPNSLAYYTDITNSTRYFASAYPGSGAVYNTTFSLNNTNPVLCGNNSWEITLWNGNAIFGLSPKIAIDTSVYKYLQFYVILGNGNATSINVMVNNGTSIFVSKVVPPQYIDNFYIDTINWSRVRLPLISFLGFNSNQTVNYIGFSRSEVKGVPITYYIDEIRFITNIVDTNTTVGITNSEVYSHQNVCSDAPPLTSATIPLTTDAAASSEQNSASALSLSVFVSVLVAIILF